MRKCDVEYRLNAYPFTSETMDLMSRHGSRLALLSAAGFPPDAVHLGSEADLADFFDRIRRLKQEALRQRGWSGRPAETREGRTGPLHVRAHGYEKDGEFVPIRRVLIFEVNNYRNRTTEHFYQDWFEPEYAVTHERARVGRHYRVVVTWADGTRQERDVRLDSPEGRTVDVWHR